MGELFVVEVLVWLIIGYFLGSISFGYIIGKDAGVDIRNSGSGNIGTTNAMRTLGIKAGLLTFFGDMFKALIPVVLSTIISVECFNDSPDFSLVIGLITGLGVTMGHNFPVWMKFKGGKGIAVIAGVTIGIAYVHWYYILIAFLLFVLVVVITKYVSLGSLLVPAWVLPVYALIYKRDNEYFTAIIILSVIYTVLAFIMHRANIKRLVNGTENKLFGDK